MNWAEPRLLLMVLALLGLSLNISLLLVRCRACAQDTEEYDQHTRVCVSSL